MDLYFFFKVDRGRIQTFLKDCTGNQYMVKSAENWMRSNLELLLVMNVKKMTQNRSVF
jgi:hypothetical protein